MDERWVAIAREAALAAEHLASGVTALGRANYATHANYALAFFALSTGLERSSKLALVLDHAIRTGAFPDEPFIRKYRHRISELLGDLDQTAERLGLKDPTDRLPQTEVHKAIIECLSDFADNVSRYYNLDLLVRPSVDTETDPLVRWHRDVTEPILADLYGRGRLVHLKVEEQARATRFLLEGRASVLFHTEMGNVIDKAGDATRASLLGKAARREEQLHVLQIARFIAAVMATLGEAAHSKPSLSIPELGEFFALFRNDDKYLKSRSTWSIYRP